VVVRNTGTVRLANLDLAGDENDCATALLQPGSTHTCKVWRSITVSHFAEGSVALKLSVLSVAPKGLAPALASLPEDTATVQLAPGAAMDLSLSATVSYSQPGFGSLTLAAMVSNTGAMALDQLQLVAEGVSATFTCGDGAAVPGSLQPAEKRTCTAVVPLTLDMLDAGGLTAVVKGFATADQMQVTATDTKKVTLAGVPAITAKLIGCEVPSTANDNPVYVCSLTIGNSGNARLRNVAAGTDCSTPLLAPGATHKCNWKQAVTQADFDAADVQQQPYIVRAVVTGFTNGPVSTAVEQVVAVEQLVLPVAAKVSVDTSVTPTVARKTGKCGAA
jgi:hypothetical protein